MDYVEKFNVIVEQKQFGNYSTTTWANDCLACNNDVHSGSQPISENCQMCVEFSPVEKIYPLHGLTILLFVVGVILVIIKVSKK